MSFYPLSSHSPTCPSLFIIRIKANTGAGLSHQVHTRLDGTYWRHCTCVVTSHSVALLAPSSYALPCPCLSPQLQEFQPHPLRPSFPSFSVHHQVCRFDLLKGSFHLLPLTSRAVVWDQIQGLFIILPEVVSDCSLLVLSGLLPQSCSPLSISTSDWPSSAKAPL